MRRSNAIAYRADIDGMRAISIAAVVGFHSAPEFVPGGFIGVDVFFVISGYLISSIVFLEIDEGRFSLLNFYARRIKRLFPALLAVLMTTALAGWFYLLRFEFRDLGAQIAGAAAYVVNFVFRDQGGYFDSWAGPKPLLHLWSLSIEEQYYIFYPAILLLVRRCGNRWTSTFLFALTIISATSSILETRRHEAAAFYLTPFRLWELSAGAVLAQMEKPMVRFGGWLLRGALSLIGLSLVVGSAFGLSVATFYPGVWAFIPCLGAILLIAGGDATPINRWILSNKAMVAIGLISYPLYLWHWPLLSFSNILWAGGDWRVKLGATSAATILSIATYVLIEKPVSRVEGSAVPFGLFVAMGTICIAGLCIFEGAFAARLDDPHSQNLIASIADQSLPNGWRMQREPSDRASHLAGRGADRTMYVGDSNIEQYWPRIEQLLREGNSNKSAVFVTEPGCLPIPGVFEGARPRCEGFAESAMALADKLGVSTVVIGALWPFYFNDGGAIEKSDARRRALGSLLLMIKSLRSRGMAVYIILSIPSGPGLAPRDGLRRSWTGALEIVPTSLDRHTFDERWAVSRSELIDIARATGSTIIDPMASLCNLRDCPSQTPDGLNIYRDAAHLSATYVRDRALFIDQTLLHPLNHE
jgi:peptidoglycan/LPS O-acetylase OafA/YrhL